MRKCSESRAQLYLPGGQVARETCLPRTRTHLPRASGQGFCRALLTNITNSQSLKQNTRRLLPSSLEQRPLASQPALRRSWSVCGNPPETTKKQRITQGRETWCNTARSLSVIVWADVTTPVILFRHESGKSVVRDLRQQTTDNSGSGNTVQHCTQLIF